MKISGVALTADSAWLGGTYYWYISLTHETVVVLWLISLPFRLIGITFEAVFALLKSLLMLPARVLGSRKQA